MHKIQEVFHFAYGEFKNSFNPSPQQHKTARDIMDCKTGRLGIHASSCHNRSCPCCQGIDKELWLDARKAEVIDASYYHVVFTIPAELNPVLYAHQGLLYQLLHKCAAQTLLELAADKKYLGAVPGIIQVLHTWGQKLNYHPHIHCIITGAGLTKASQLITKEGTFFIPVAVLGAKFRGKFLSGLQELYESGRLVFQGDLARLQDSREWNALRDSLYLKTWVPFIKETFNGSGNAMEYLGRYTHRIAISNSRILRVSESHVTFRAKDYRTGRRRRSPSRAWSF